MMNGMPEEQNLIPTLKVMRDVLSDFSKLVENLNIAAEKHGIPISEIQNFNLSSTDSLQVLVKALPSEKIGLLVGVSTKLVSMQYCLTNLMNHDAQQLQDFNAQLKTTIEKFDKVLEGL